MKPSFFLDQIHLESYEANSTYPRRKVLLVAVAPPVGLELGVQTMASLGAVLLEDSKIQ